MAARYGGRAFARYEDFLAHRPMDLVVIGSPSGVHAEQGIAAAERGLHVLVEKPIDVSTARGETLVAAAGKAGVKLGVLFQDRLKPDLVRLRGFLAGGGLGRVLVASARVKWHRPPEYYSASTWRGTKALDGGAALVNQGIHTVDLLLWLLGPVAEVRALTGTLLHAIEGEDVALALLRFASGALATLEATTVAFPGYPRRVEISGTEGTVVVEGDRVVAADLRTPAPGLVSAGDEGSGERRDGGRGGRDAPPPHDRGLRPRDRHRGRPRLRRARGPAQPGPRRGGVRGGPWRRGGRMSTGRPLPAVEVPEHAGPRGGARPPPHRERRPQAGRPPARRARPRPRARAEPPERALRPRGPRVDGRRRVPPRRRHLHRRRPAGPRRGAPEPPRLAPPLHAERDVRGAARAGGRDRRPRRAERRGRAPRRHGRGDDRDVRFARGPGRLPPARRALPPRGGRRAAATASSPRSWRWWPPSSTSCARRPSSTRATCATRRRCTAASFVR